MTIPLTFLARYAIPLIVASIYLGDVADIREQIAIFDKTERLSDETIAKARKEGEGTETFDYIIVGAGSAGALLANRLTASGEFTVLLLEAGGDPNPIWEVPFGSSLPFSMGITDWNYTTVRQAKGCGNNDGVCGYNRGKALGGSSSVNGLIYNRGKPKDYDRWANFTEDESWSWANVKETFNSFENYRGFYEETAGNRHGSQGEMYIGGNDFLPGHEVVEEALKEKGFQMGDLNGGEDFTYGFSKMEYNIKNGLRLGTFQAFLEPILERPNLKIYRHAQATQVVTIGLGDLTHRAVGVTYERHGVTRTAMVNKEVIISAGVIGSPKLLMLSGIGPKEHLEELGIEVVLDLPVGLYLQDHPGVDLSGEAGGFLLNTTFARERNTEEDVAQFIANGTGPFNTFDYGNPAGGVFGTQMIKGYFNSSLNDDKTWPDLQAYIYERSQPAVNRQEIHFALELVRHSTFGSVRLASKDPHDKPLIDPKLLSDPEDVQKLLDGIEVMQDIFLNSVAFQKWGIRFIEGKYGPCEGQEGRDYWRCLVEHKTVLFYHPTSTCRMGPDREVAVLDSKMKVFGTQNLRVVDASSMPFVPSGNTNHPAMLMGARGAEIILAGQ